MLEREPTVRYGFVAYSSGSNVMKRSEIQRMF